MRGTGVHAVMGTGGAPEGVITAAAMRCLGGEIQARLVATDERQEQRLAALGYHDLDKIYQTEDLAPGDADPLLAAPASPTASCCAASASSAAARAPPRSSCRCTRKMIRFVDTIHREDLDARLLRRLTLPRVREHR